MSGTAFENVIGYEAIKLELSRILDQMNNPEKYAKLGVMDQYGLLLYGEPGVGKSTFAQSFLDASGRKAFICRKDKPNGDFVNEIKRIFDQAAAEAPSVILLDDLDKFSNEDELHRDAEEYVTVQTCIDQVKKQDVFVVATANNIDKLPASLIRAGRFDYTLELGCPELEDAEKIIAYYLSKKQYVADMDIHRLSRLLEGKSCADLERMVNQAGVFAAYAGKEQIDMDDMIKAILRLIFRAPEKAGADERKLELIACHEAGHALIAELLEPGSVDLVSVLCHNSATAGVTSLTKDPNYFLSKELMEIRVMCLLAGKAATEVCFGMVDTGITSDMRRVFDIVHRFVDDYCTYGFDKFVYCRDVSDALLERRDAQVATEVERYYLQTRKLIIENRQTLDKLIAALLEKKTLLNDQITQILHGA